MDLYEIDEFHDTLVIDDDISEKQTRKQYIDEALKAAGWTIGLDCRCELPVIGMDNASGNGFVDYALIVDEVPLGIVEAKKASIDPRVGFEQARQYARLIEQKHSVKPVIFLTNGITTIIYDNIYPPRVIKGFYSPKDLVKQQYRYEHRNVDLSSIPVPKYIRERGYQIMAFKKALEAFDSGRRKALLAMATGSGKTRVSIAICQALIEIHKAQKVLFLTDREQLIRQASDSFEEHYRSIVRTEIYGKNTDKNYDAHLFISCYPSMMKAIQDVQEGGHRKFTTGFFDLIIIDEAHRSIYDTYRGIIDHFDALVLGLTATPKETIDHNTFEFFDIYDGKPTFGFSLADGVALHLLVPPKIVAPLTERLSKGAIFDSLSDSDKERYIEAFRESDGEFPPSKAAEEFYNKIYNEDTIRILFEQLFLQGQRIDSGATLGKTIIFAPYHKYAALILRTFQKLYPDIVRAIPEYCRIIDIESCGPQAQNIIKDFKDGDRTRIVIAVSMMDTGVDIPDLLNLVFFRKVGSKTLLMQMIGRGTRICKGLIDGKDKEFFTVFDYCHNFEERDFYDAPSQKSLHEKVFNIKALIVKLLQNGSLNSEEFIQLRESLVSDLLHDISLIDRTHFTVLDGHVVYVDLYSKPERFDVLTDEDLELLSAHVAPFTGSVAVDVRVERFDGLLYTLEAASLMGADCRRQVADLQNKAIRLKNEMGSNRKVKEKMDLLDSIIQDKDIKNWSAPRFEYVRNELRDLIKLLKKKSIMYRSELSDHIVSVEDVDLNLEQFGTLDYRNKMYSIIDKYRDNEVIQKIYENKPLTIEDVEVLQDILFKEVGGTPEKYREVFGNKSLVRAVREYIGLDMDVVIDAFSDFVMTHDIDERIAQFLNIVIDRLSTNGILLATELTRFPFVRDGVTMDSIFGKRMLYLADIRTILDDFNTKGGVVIENNQYVS